ncbi:hypothetical protein CTAYLR_009363 [Chrysophaeum taylorii]|uniref:Nudix hydrolase domain-containing protein n=1 Tax=Chrysophaeum taylorii TaxID=2483200 RepID=A0AAD7XNA3_9STRA|nr:hypothetical protein CTAYLR_009363 [Chrysophaeum taylorii]
MIRIVILAGCVSQHGAFAPVVSPQRRLALPAATTSAHGNEDEPERERRRRRSARAQSRLSDKTIDGRRVSARRLSSSSSPPPPPPSSDRSKLAEDTQSERCGYCGELFDSRLSLFRHLRDDDYCRALALSDPAVSVPLVRMPAAKHQETSRFPGLHLARNKHKQHAHKRLHRCGYCGLKFNTRSKLFRHLREDNACRKLAISHGMPLENPYRSQSILRHVYGDILLAGCIVLYRKMGRPAPTKRTFRTGCVYTNDALLNKYQVVLVRNQGGRGGFPKGKVETTDRTLLSAALRETWEEAGLGPGQLHVLPSWAADEIHKLENVAETKAKDDDDDDDVEGDADDIEEEEEEEEDDDDLPASATPDETRFSENAACVDVKEITGRFGKRARYFVCAIVDPDSDDVIKRPASTRAVALTSTNDLDGDIEMVKWYRAPEAIRELGAKRRTALRRAIAIHELYFERLSRGDGHQDDDDDISNASRPRR